MAERNCCSGKCCEGFSLGQLSPDEVYKGGKLIMEAMEAMDAEAT
jgi:hypothetical protein